jgi:hypothetical protein
VPTKSVKFAIIGEAADGKRAFRDVADEAERAGDKVDDFGHHTRGLDDEIRRLTTSTAHLKRELAATGDKGVLRDLTKDESTLRKLQRVRGEFQQTESVLDRISKKGFSGLSDTIGEIPSQLKGSLILGAVAGAAAISPLIISAVAGAAVTAAVAGAVAGGVALAFIDPKVKGAAADLADDVKRDMIDAGRSFVEPVQRGITLLRAAWRADIGPELTAAIRSAAQYVEPLAKAGAEFATPLVEGFRYMVDRAGPVVDMLKADLPGLGQQLKQLMQTFGDNADTGAKALHDIIVLTDMVIDGWNAATKAAAATYDVWQKFGAIVGGPAVALQDLYEASNKVAVQAKWVDPQIQAWNRYKLEIDANTAAMKRYNSAVDETIGKTLNLDQSTIAFREGMRQLKEQLAGTKHTLDMNTEAGLANRKAILGQIEVANRMREAAIAEGDGSWAATQKANQAWRSQLQQIRALAIAMGLPKSQIDAMLQSYLALVRAPNIHKEVSVRIRTFGSLPAGTGLRDVYGFSTGGEVRGGVPGVDSVSIMAKPKEYVLTEPMVNELGGLDFLESLRLGRSRPAPAGGGTAAPAGGGGMDAAMVERSIERAMRRALAGATLVIDDRTGTRAQLIVRAG